MSDDLKVIEQPASGGQLPPEDTGSQALGEALRSSFAIVKWLMVVLVICFICSGMFQVKSGERAVRLHFGKPVGEGTKALLGPGLHWSWPYPIDEVRRIKYSEIQKVSSTVGWYSSENAIGMSLNPATEGYTLTSDGNIIHVRAALYYRIVDPVAYEFDFTNAPLTIQNALDNALVYASSRFTVDQILTKETTRFLETIQGRVSDLVDKEKVGIAIERPPDLEISPPLGLKKSFEDVVTALSTREKLHSDALAYTSSTTNQATAEAAVLTNTAQVERTQLVASVQAEAAYFNSVLPQYRANPSFVANLLLAERLGQIMTNVENKFYIPERADGKTSELRLQLSREPQVSKPAAPAAPIP